MNPEQIEVVGDFLAIRWEDSAESILPLEGLRRACPCARCAGEPDVTGRVRRHPGPPLATTASSFQVVRFERVGNYAIQIVWADGHDTGIFTWPMLRDLGQDTDE